MYKLIAHILVGILIIGFIDNASADPIDDQVDRCVYLIQQAEWHARQSEYWTTQLNDAIVAANNNCHHGMCWSEYTDLLSIVGDLLGIERDLFFSLFSTWDKLEKKIPVIVPVAFWLSLVSNAFFKFPAYYNALNAYETCMAPCLIAIEQVEYIRSQIEYHLGQAEAYIWQVEFEEC